MSHGGGHGGGGVEWTNPLSVFFWIFLVDLIRHSELEGVRWGFQGKEGGGHGH